MTSKFKIKKSLNGNYVLNLRSAFGTKAIKDIATPEELTEAREWVQKFYEGEYKVEALKDLMSKEPKYKNGAVVCLPNITTKYWYINFNSSRINYTTIGSNHFFDKQRLEAKNLFITMEEAEEYLRRQKIFNRLEKAITLINYNNNWVADWNDANQEKYYLCQTYNVNFLDAISRVTNDGAHYMCQQAMNWLLSDQVTDEERKIWINQ